MVVSAGPMIGVPARFREIGTYEVESVTPVDLFPQTFHVETVTRLYRR